jgi:phosphoglycerate dehydrogenase-like enzyme
MEYFDEIIFDLINALEKGEIVYITLPLTPQTRGMFDKNILDQMQDKFLVNVGRGEVIEEAALYHALKNGILKGAGIDVWYTYPERGKGVGNPSKYPIQEFPNVVLSPHIAGLAYQAVLLNFEQTFENIRSYLKTGDPLFEVDLNLMY